MERREREIEDRVREVVEGGCMDEVKGKRDDLIER